MKSLANFAVLSCVWAATGALAAPITSPPAHYYNFDAGTGTVALDSGSIGGANATLTSATWSTNTPFSYAGNRSVTTTNTGVQAAAFVLGTQSTISLWAYWTGAVSTPQYLLDSANNASRTLVYFDSGNSPLIAFGGNFFGNAFAQPTAVGWQNIVMARNGTALRVYQNGTLTSTNTLNTASTINAGTWSFGQRFNGIERFRGQIDEYSFWSQELDAAQIQRLYASGTGSLFVPEPGTAALAGLALLGLVLTRKWAQQV